MLYKKLIFSLLFILMTATYSFSATGQKTSVAETMDLWRGEKYSELYDNLTDRKTLSKEEFISLMRTSSVKPACCHRQIKSFEVLKESSKASEVYMTIGLDGVGKDSVTKEFKLKKINDRWAMKLNDIVKMAEVRKIKKPHRYRITR